GVNPFRAVAISCRPRQWIKNGLVFIPLISSASFTSKVAIGHSAAAAAAFTLMASAVYLCNDIADRAGDRQHPAKKMRPLATGALTPGAAAIAAVLLAAESLRISAWLGGKVLLVLALYAVSNAGYSLGLRKEPVLDVLLVSAGFVMRPVAGAYAIP